MNALVRMIRIYPITEEAGVWHFYYLPTYMNNFKYGYFMRKIL